MEDFYIIGNNITPFDYSFSTPLLKVSLSPDDFVKLCENIEKYLTLQPDALQDKLYLGNISLNTTYKNCINTIGIEGKKPFFIWGSRDNPTLSQIRHFKTLQNSLFIEENYDLSNPFILSEIIHKYFSSGRSTTQDLYKPVDRKATKVDIYKYEFGNNEINSKYSPEFTFVYDRLAWEKRDITVKHINVFDSPILQNLPSPDASRGITTNLKFHVYAMCYNESLLLPHFLRYYKDADQIFILDNYSNDKTEQIVKASGRTLIKFNTGNTFNDVVHKHIKNNIWKLSRGIADYVILIDLDEFLYFPDYADLKSAIQALKSQKIPYVKTTGYNICFGDGQFERIKTDILEHTVYGYRHNSYDKCLIFNPDIIQETNFREGGHEMYPIPNLPFSENINCFLLHYKHIDKTYEYYRKVYCRDRFSFDNITRGYGGEYFISEEAIKKEIDLAHTSNQNIYDIIHRKPRLTCNIVGGLGNQLFMVAAALGHAWRNNMLPVFKKKLMDGAEAINNQYWNNILQCIPFNTELDDTNFTIVYENKEQKYEPIKTEYKNTMLFLYFQSIKYWEEYEHKIREMFTHYLTDKYNADTWYIDKTYERFKMEVPNRGKKLVGVFVRRGDYLKLNGWCGTWVLPLEYYHRAMDMVRETESYRDCNFIIFSQDTEWCKENFPGYLVYNNESDYIQLLLLSKMDGYIFANSTFSWWAEFLGNPDKSKLVISPTPWLKNHNYNDQIYRDHWKKLEW